MSKIYSTIPFMSKIYSVILTPSGVMFEYISKVLSKSTTEKYTRVTTSDHEWPRMTTSDFCV